MRISKWVFFLQKQVIVFVSLKNVCCDFNFRMFETFFALFFLYHRLSFLCFGFLKMFVLFFNDRTFEHFIVFWLFVCLLNTKNHKHFWSVQEMVTTSANFFLMQENPTRFAIVFVIFLWKAECAQPLCGNAL